MPVGYDRAFRRQQRRSQRLKIHDLGALTQPLPIDGLRDRSFSFARSKETIAERLILDGWVAEIIASKRTFLTDDESWELPGRCGSQGVLI